MKTLLIAALAAAGLMTCACTSQNPAAAPPATAATAGHHHHRAPGGAGQGSGATTPGGATGSNGSAQGGSGGSGPGGSGSAGSGSGGSGEGTSGQGGSGQGTSGQGGSGQGTSGQGGAQDTAATPPACLTRYLGAKAGISQGTAGSTYVAIVFKNLLNSPCTLYGYPGISLAGGMPVTQIGRAAKENPATPRQLVTLAPGGKANALLQIVHAADYPASKCGPVTAQWLQIYPPNQSVPIYLSYTSLACTKPVHLLTVNTVVPGTGG